MRQLILLLVLFIGFNVSFGFATSSRLKRQGSCRTAYGDQGRCIKITECKPLFDLLTNNRNDPKVREILQKSSCGYADNLPKVCCQTQSSNPDPRPPIDSFNQFPNECGKSNVSSNRIVGGRPAELRAWPWMALLGYKSANINKRISWLCGGALVSNKIVVTAAHCLPSKVLIVRLGELDHQRDDDGANHIDVPVESQKAHEEYDSSVSTSDIGIVRLRNAVTFNNDIQPICLPFTEQIRTKNFVGFNPYIAGWGKTQHEGSSSSHLQEAQVEVRALSVCQDKYYALDIRPPRKHPVIDERTVCAGGGKKDSCQGDSGGPLMIPQNGVFYLYGVVSYGYKCAEPGYPGIYTKITQFLDWIARNSR